MNISESVITVLARFHGTKGTAFTARIWQYLIIPEQIYALPHYCNGVSHALCLNNVLQENADMKNRILFEKAPSSEKFLTEVISLTYQSFYHPEPSTFNVRPYCVKYFKKRWYMLASSDLGLRIYSHDRFDDMEEVDQT